MRRLICRLFGHWFGMGSFQTFHTCRRCGQDTRNEAKPDNELLCIGAMLLGVVLIIVIKLMHS